MSNSQKPTAFHLETGSVSNNASASSIPSPTKPRNFDSLPDISLSPQAGQPLSPLSSVLMPDSPREAGHAKQRSEDLSSKRRIARASQPARFSDSVNSVDDTLRNFKWIEAIRNEDLESLSLLLIQTRTPSVGLTGTPIHLAAAFGSRNVLEFLLKSSVSFPVNAQDSNGNTALHVACRAGRVAIVEMLLKLPNIDTSVQNLDGKDCKQISKSSLIIDLIESTRKSFVQTKVKELFGYATSGNLGAIRAAFTDPRVSKLVDINTQDQMSAETILHYAAEQNDVEMVMWCLNMKADAMIRDKQGKLASDKTKNDKIKSVLKDAMAQPAVSATSTSGNASIKMQGFLYKWTNFARGYKKRWFVLQDGVFSYYGKQEDYPVSCRGSVSLKVARLNMDTSDKNKFELVAPGNVKYHVRAEHAAEARKWVIAITETKQWLQDNLAYVKASGSQVFNNDVDLESDRKSESSSEEGGLNGSSAQSDTDTENFEEKLSSIINAALANLTLQEQTYEAIPKVVTQTEKMTEMLASLKKSSDLLAKSLEEISAMSQSREQEWARKLEREERIKKVWEDNLRTLAAEHDELQSKATEEVINFQTLSLSRGELKDQTEDEEFFDAISDFNREHKTFASDNSKSLISSASIGYPDESKLRKELPMVGSEAKVEISLWSVLRNNIGKDLSKIALPVFFNEPLSMLQRLCEEMEYSTLLDIASSRKSSLERLQFVAAFAMSSYSSTLGRTGKPFNPLLGETFEYVRRDRGFRYMSEQVSHHPVFSHSSYSGGLILKPISACHCESENYEFWAEVKIKTQFWGKSLEIHPQGISHLILKNTREHFSWKKVTTAVNNLIVGKLWVDHYGDMEIINHSTGESCILSFNAAGWGGRGQYEIKGKVMDSAKGIKGEISGHWNDKLVSKSLESAQPVVLWKRLPVPDHASKMFNFTEFAANLNQIDDSLAKNLCPTDSRFRPDQRAMERGMYDLADKEKIKVEEKQRARRKKQHEKKIEWEPTWFRQEIDKDTGSSTWKYKGGYWESRTAGKWPAVCENIF